MKIILAITQDSDNSYPSANVEIGIYDNEIRITIDDNDRTVHVNRAEFEQVLHLLAGTNAASIADAVTARIRELTRSRI